VHRHNSDRQMQDLIEPVFPIVLFAGGKESLAVDQILRNMPIEYETPLQRRQISTSAAAASRIVLWIA